MGNSLLEIVAGLDRANLLKQLIVSSNKATSLPSHKVVSQGWIGRGQKRLAFYERTGWGEYLVNRLFDHWAVQVMQPADIFESWTGFCVTSLQAAKQRGSRTILALGSAHPRDQVELVNAERRRWGLKPLHATPTVRQIEQELVLADTVLVQSRFSQQSLSQHGVPARKQVRIPLGVNITRYSPAVARPAGSFRVLFVGQVTLRKGVPCLLEAWKQLAWPDAELRIVGQVLPDCGPALRHFAGLPGVAVEGYTADPLAAFHSSDVFIAPSVEDGFGLVVAEAMACGLPVVVSDHTGAADLVQHGENGFVVSYSDVAGYAAALETLRANPSLANRMGRAARATAQRHTWTAYQQRLVDLHLDCS
jgi:glycosyltransferase involved in cell wall biosynthesis